MKVENLLIPGIIVIVYMAGIMMVGWIAGRHIQTSDDYLVAGRRMPIWMTTGALLASFICAGTIMGGAGAAYQDGYVGAIYDPFAAALALVLAGFFYMKLVRLTKVRSMGSFYGLRFGPTSVALSSILMVPTYILWSTVQIMAIGKILSAILGWDYMTTAFIGGILVIIYTYWGGILAVAWTDFIQCILLIIGIVVLYVMGLNIVGGVESLKAQVPAEFFSILPRDYSLVGLLAYLAMWTGCCLGALPAPDLLQRSFIAKDGKTASQAGVIAGVLMFILGVLIVYIGISGIVIGKMGIIPGDLVEADPEMVVPLMAIALMNPYMLGLFVSALLAAVMSSASSALFAPASILANDIVRPIMERNGKQISDKQLTRITQLSVITIGILALMLGLVSDSLYDLLILAFTLLCCILFFPFTYALFWKKANAYGMVAAMAVGFIIPLGLAISQGTIIPEPEWVLVLIPTAASGIVGAVVSLATQKICPPQPLVNIDGEIIKWPELAQQQPLASTDKQPVGV